jgi:hypothetical protein
VKKTIIALTLVIAIALTLAVTIPTFAYNNNPTTTITGIIAPAIDVSVSSTAFTLSGMVPGGTGTGSVTVTVKSNDVWSLVAKSDSTDGKMYVGTVGTTPLATVLSVNGAAMTSAGTAITPTTHGVTEGTPVTAAFTQPVLWTDAAATYTMVVTFTGSNP